MGEYNVETALRKRKKTGGGGRKRGRRMVDVCATYSAVIRSYLALCLPLPRQIPLDTILSLLYTLSRPVIHRDSTGVEGWRCSFPGNDS